MNERPQPVVNAATIASAVTALVGVLVTLGVLSAEEGTTITNSAAILIGAVVTVVGVISHLVAAFHARSQVTPLESPQDNSGKSLA